MSKNRKRWLCQDCRVDTSAIREHYFVYTELWTKAGMGERGMLCLGCLSERLGRSLTAQDFPPVHINRPGPAGQSERLRAALTRV